MNCCSAGLGGWLTLLLDNGAHVEVSQLLEVLVLGDLVGERDEPVDIVRHELRGPAGCGTTASESAVQRGTGSWAGLERRLNSRASRAAVGVLVWAEPLRGVEVVPEVRQLPRDPLGLEGELVLQPPSGDDAANRQPLQHGSEQLIDGEVLRLLGGVAAAVGERRGSEGAASDEGEGG
jgi:hypothetical protein